MLIPIPKHLENLSIKFSMSELKIIYHYLVQGIHQRNSLVELGLTSLPYSFPLNRYTSKYDSNLYLTHSMAYTCYIFSCSKSNKGQHSIFHGEPDCFLVEPTQELVKHRGKYLKYSMMKDCGRESHAKIEYLSYLQEHVTEPLS